MEQLLLSVEDVAPHYRLVVERPEQLDELTVECEPTGQGVDRSALSERLEGLLREQTGIRITVEVVEVGAIPRSEGKAVRMVDRRTAS